MKKIYSSQMTVGHSVRNTENHGDSFKFLQIPEQTRASAKGADKLVLDNIPLVAHFVKRFSSMSYVSKDDMFQAGLEGLIRASRGFNEEYNVKFSSYASIAILRGIGSTLYSAAYPVTLTYKTAKKITEMNRIIKSYKTKKDRDPTMEELAKELKLDFEMTFVLKSLSEHITIDFQDDAVDNMVQVNNVDEEYEKTYALNEYLKLLYDRIEMLPILEGSVMLLRSGLYDSHGYSVSEVGYVLGLAPGMIRDIEFSAIDHMRDPSMAGLLTRLEIHDTPWDYICAKIYDRQAKQLTSDPSGLSI